MKQFQISYDNRIDFAGQLAGIRDVCAGYPRSTSFFYITWAASDRKDLSEVTAEIERFFPASPYYGAEASGNIAKGRFSIGIHITCYLFEEEDSKAELVWVEQGTAISSLDDLWKYCGGKEGLRAVEMIPSMSYVETLAIDGNIPDIGRDVLLFGGASVNYDSSTYDADIIAKGHPRTGDGMAVMLYFGESLRFTSKSILGWKGLGRLMEVTDSSGKCIRQINRSPAYSIYEKYLNLSIEDKDTLVFPLIVEEEGYEFIRTPQIIMPDKSMQMFANIPNGTKVRIAYGDRNTILDEIYSKAREIAEFNPEVIKAYSCAARRLFWGDQEVSNETVVFEDIAPVCGFYTGGEILRFGTKLRVLNQTLAITAISESPNKRGRKEISIRAKTPDTSLVSRLAYFTEKVSEEQLREQEMLEKERKRNELMEGVANAEGIFLIDCINNTRKTLHDSNYADLYNDEDGYTRNINRYIETYVAELDREMMHRETSPAYILKRIRKEKEYTVIYRDTSSGIQRFYEMRIARYSDTEVLISFKENDKNIVERLVFDKLRGAYFALFCADLEAGLVQTMKNDPGYFTEVGSIVPYTPLMQEMACGFEGETRKYFESLGDIAYLKKKFASIDKATYAYKSPLVKQGQWALATELVLSRTEAGTPQLYALALSYLDEEAGRVYDMQVKLQEDAQMIGGLASGYYALYYFNISEKSFIVYSLDGKKLPKAEKIVKGDSDPVAVFQKFGMSDLVHPDDRHLFTSLSLDLLRDNLAHSKKYSFRFRRNFNGEYRWSELDLIKYEEVDEPANIIAIGFADRDTEIRKEQEQQKQLEDALAKEIARSRDEKAYQLAILNNAYSYFRINLTKNQIIPPIIEKEDNQPVDYTDKFPSPMPSYDAIMSMGAERYVDEAYQDSYREYNSCEYLIRCFNEGNLMPEYICYIYSSRIGWHYRKYVTYLSKDEISGEIFGMEVAYDVTKEFEAREKEKKYQEELAKAVSEAQAANQSKTSFLFNMSHDIRTPMNAITGFTNMAKKHIDDREKVTDYLDKIDTSGHQLLNLINQVLEMARIESGKYELDEKVVNIREEYESSVTVLAEQAKANGQEFHYSLCDCKHNYVLADAARMGSITLNITGNAMKYTPKGGRIDYILREVEPRKEGYATFVFTVEDTGIGMSEEYLKVLFDPFTREKNTTVSKIQGTGLGMSIVKQLVDLMGGNIEVHSELGKGTRFDVTVDLKIVEDAEATREKAPDTKLLELKGRKVLLVEDNELNREIADDILQEGGLLVENAEDGSVAIHLLQEKGPNYYDFILMDIQMPIIGGYEATRIIRDMYPDKHIPIIAVSANAFAEDKSASLAAGMDDHVAKPINIDELFAALENLL